MRYYSLTFGQAYGSGAYGSGNYACSTQQQQDGSCNAAASTSSGSGSNLTNTGIPVLAIVTLACLIIFVALLVRWWRKPKAESQVVAAETVPVDETESEDRDQ